MHTQSFEQYLTAADGVTSLAGLRSTAARTAASANTAFMHEERVRLRRLLRAAARRGALPWGSALHDAFRRSSAASSKAVTITDLDEAVTGDDAFNPIVVE